jgi:hypothetical protein
MKYIVSLLFIVLNLLTLFAQKPVISAKLDKTQLIIGDQATLHLEVTAPKGTPIQGFDTSILDTLPKIEWINKSKLLIKEENGNIKGVQAWTMQVWESGDYNIPEVQFFMQNDGLPFGLTQNIPFKVKTFENLDSLKLNPIKPILLEATVWQDYMPFILGVLCVLALLGGLIWWKYRKKQPIKTIETIVPTLTAAQIALQKVEKLRAARLWQQGKVKSYYSELTFILREYLENQYQIKALESTSDEIMEQLNQQNASFPTASIQELLLLADMVKFAKAAPDDTAHEGWLAFLEGYLREK